MPRRRIRFDEHQRNHRRAVGKIRPARHQQLRVDADAVAGKLRDDPDVFALFEKTTAEVAAVGRARGIRLPADIEARTLQTIRNFPPEMMPSMAVDLLRGNRLELPWLAGKVVALGREVGVPTPTFDVMYAALKPYANGAPA
jgi:2-dehydropantoate 2-reductase